MSRVGIREVVREQARPRGGRLGIALVIITWLACPAPGLAAPTGGSRAHRGPDAILALQGEGDFDGAIAEVRRQIPVQKSVKAANALRFYLADLLQRVGRHEEARQAFSEVFDTRLAPDLAAALYGIAQTSLAIEDTDRARFAAAELARVAPDAPVIEFARFMFETDPLSIDGRLGGFFTALAQARTQAGEGTTRPAPAPATPGSPTVGTTSPPAVPAPATTARPGKETTRPSVGPGAETTPPAIRAGTATPAHATPDPAEHPTDTTSEVPPRHGGRRETPVSRTARGPSAPAAIPGSASGVPAAPAAHGPSLPGRDEDVPTSGPAPGQDGRSLPAPLPGEPLPLYSETSRPPTATGDQGSETRDTRIQGFARVWNSDLQGSIVAKGLDLDLGGGTDTGSQNRGQADLQVFFGRGNHLGVSYLSFDHQGRPTGTITFDRSTYSPLSAFRLHTRYYEWFVGRRFSRTDRGEWSARLGYLWSKAEMTLTQRFTTGERVGTLNQHLSMPFLGIEGETRLGGSLRLHGFANVSSTDGGNAGGTFHDIALEILIGGRSGEHEGKLDLAGALGFRHFALDGEVNHHTIDVRFAGPTFGLTGRF
ncbi:MAG: hypothetical protein GX442_15235 [Candidatus Riflebacteria bacterium]|nr:hypothetical protein [Candidatus Riflebacteria bacterium]